MIKAVTALTPEQRAGLRGRTKSKMILVYVTPAQHERYIELGGAETFRRMLEATIPPAKTSDQDNE